MANETDGQIVLGLNFKKSIEIIQRQLKQISENLKMSIPAKIDTTKLKKDLANLENELRFLITAQLDREKTLQRLNSDLDKLELDDIKLDARIDREETQRQLSEDLRRLDVEQVRIAADLDMTALRQQLGNIDNINVDGQCDNLGETADEIENINRRSAAAATTIALLHRAFTELEEAARRIVNTSVELDEKLTDLRMVTGENYDAAAALVREYNALAGEIGATTAQVLEASSEWLRQGKSVAETEQLIEQSMILSKVGKMESATATERLTSALNGYKLEAADASSVVDKLVSLDMEAATSADELAEALSHTASSANLAGVDLNKILAYLTVVSETTRKSASTIGESFKSIFARMGKVTNGEGVDDFGEDISKVESTLRDLGVELRVSETEFRNFDDVLDDIGSKWSTLSSVTQREIATAFAGVYQSENFLALMNNYDKVAQYVDVASNSAGTAAEKFNAYQDSVKAHYNSLVAAAESLAMNTATASFMNGVLDATTALLKFVDGTHLLQITLSTLAAAGAVRILMGIRDISVDAFHTISQLSNAFNILSRAGEALSVDDFERLRNITNGLNESQMRLIVTQSNLTNAQRLQLLMSTGLSQQEAQQTLVTLGLATAEGTATTATFSLSGAFRALGAAIAANPIGFIVTTLTALISIIGTIASEAKQAEEDARRAALEAGEAAKKEAQSIVELTNAYESAYAAYQNNTGSKEDLESATTDLLKVLGIEQSEVEGLITKYGDLNTVINEVTTSTLKNKLMELTSGYQAAIETLMKETKDGFFTSWSLLEYKTGDEIDFSDYLVEKGLHKSASYGTGGGHFYLPNDNFDDVIESYEKLLEIREALNDGISEGRWSREELAESDIYNKISGRLSDMKDEYESVVDYINQINSLSTQLKFNQIPNSDLPKTQEEFEKLKESIIESALSSGEFIGSQEQIRDAVINTLSTMPELSQFFDNYSDALESTGNTTVEVDKNVQALNTFRNIVGTLKKAVDEYNESGNVSTDTYKKVTELSKDYADIFDFSTGKITINNDALQKHIDKLVADYGATLAANGASEDQIKTLAALAGAFTKVSEDTAVTTSTLKGLVDIYSDAAEGTELSTLAVLDLIEQYPELIGAIEQTATGYKIEESAVRDLIVEKANLLKINESLAKQAARAAFDENTNNNGKSSATVDAIFNEYYAETGKQIASFDEYVTAWEKHFGKEASGNWIDGLREYVDASIEEAKRLAFIDTLLEDLKSSDPTRWEIEKPSGTTKTEKSEFEKQYDKHQHLLAMDKESVADYLKWLRSAYGAAYTAGQIDLDEYYKYQEEVYEKTKELFDDMLNDSEHQISLLDRQDGNTDEIVKMYKELQDAVHAQAEKYRALGLDENHELIQNLQNQWWEYYDAIRDKMVESYEELANNSQNQIALTENLLDNAVAAGDYEQVRQHSDTIIAEYRKMQQIIHDEADYYRSLGYSETSNEVSKLKELWWEYYDAIVDAVSAGFNELVENANSALDEIQNVYTTLKNAAQEQADSGFITVDTLQEILSLGTNYLAMLQDENGQLVINEENIRRVIAARTQQVAVETSLNYIQQLRTALNNSDTESLNNLIFATDAATNSTWDLVYAQLAALELSDDQYAAALQRIDAIRSLADNAVTSIGQTTGQVAAATQAAAEAAQEQLEKASESLQDILDYTIEMIKQEVNNQVDALKQQVEQYKNIVDLQKESLELAREKDNYDRDVADKVEDIAKIEAKIQKLSLDDSREAQAEKAKLQEELAEMQRDLSDTQADHAYEVTVDSLDKMAEAYEEEKNKEIEILEDSISSYEKVYQLAIERINTQWDTLYQDLINWNTQYGNNTNETLTNAWNNASAAVQQYGGYLAAVKATQDALNASAGATGGGGIPSSPTSLGTSTNYSAEALKGRQVSSIVKKMKANSASWFDASDEERARLENENAQLAAQVEALLGKKLVRGQDGVWYIGSVGSKELLYEKYHKGGVVGGGTLKDNEQIAVLEKGEVVLDKAKKEAAWNIMDENERIHSISARLTPQLFGSNSDGLMNRFIDNKIKESANAMSQITNNNNTNYDVEINNNMPVHVVERLDKNEIQRFSELIGEISADHILNGFRRNGITSGVNVLMGR